MTEILQEPPFFVVGHGRSGTTLVRSKLAAHSRLAVPPETHYMARVAKADPTADAPADFDACWERLIVWRRFLDLGVDPDRVLALIDAGGARDYRSIFAAMLRAYGEAAGKPRVGEKTPGNYRHLHRLFAWFPGARIVVMRRDPRAVVASQVRSPWITEQMEAQGGSLLRRRRLFHIIEQAWLWEEAYQRYLTQAETDPRMLIVAYEDVVARPAAELQRLCEFLGETFEPAMMAGQDSGPARPAADHWSPEWQAWINEHEKKAAAGISPASLEKWRTELSPTEIAFVEQICASGMARFGYARCVHRPGAGTFGRGLLKLGGLEMRTRRRLRRLRGAQG